MEKIIVTSALPYAYSVPHLGNFVGSVLPADVFYKYLKMKGADAIFICGSDQHGTPIELAAIKKGIEPEQLADDMHSKIKGLFERMECTFSYYGKTHTEQNKMVVYELFNSLKEKGYIVPTEDMQAYCDVDKRFLTDRFIEGTCPYCHSPKARGDQCDECGMLLTPTMLIDPHCTICGKKQIRFIKVKNLAIALDKLQGKVSDFIKSRSQNNWSKNAVNKSLGLINEGLKPRDITRSMKWGFKVPAEGYEDSVIYVWFDAVIGYIGITKEFDDSIMENYWKGKDTRLVQFMGKDNIEFHTIMFPAILLGSEKGYVLPYTIKASEYLTSRSVKFSKSQGVGLNIEAALEILGADYWRFTLMHLYPESADTEFSLESLKDIVNSVMNDKIGNLVNRVLVIARNNSSTLGKPGKEGRIEVEATADGEISSIINSYKANFDKLSIREALRDAIALAALGNEIMSSTEPWALAKKAASDSKAKDDFSRIVHKLLRIVFDLGVLLYPFTPMASSKVLGYFSIDGVPSLSLLDSNAILNTSKKIDILFSKITDKEMDKLKVFENKP
ncbi:MAG: methionine--tRNA ligase [Candidatus Micrarchaeia archaeon]